MATAGKPPLLVNIVAILMIGLFAAVAWISWLNDRSLRQAFDRVVDWRPVPATFIQARWVDEDIPGSTREYQVITGTYSYVFEGKAHTSGQIYADDNLPQRDLLAEVHSKLKWNGFQAPGLVAYVNPRDPRQAYLVNNVSKRLRDADGNAWWRSGMLFGGAFGLAAVILAGLLVYGWIRKPPAPAPAGSE